MTDPLSLPAGAIGTATIDGKPVFWSRWEANDVNATSSPISYDDILADLGPGDHDPAEVWGRTPDGSWSRREIGPEQWPDVVDACPVGGLLIAQSGYRETYLHEGNFTMLQHTPDGWMLDEDIAPLQLDDPVALRGPLDVLREELAEQFADAFIGELDGPSLDTEEQVRWALVHAFLTGAAS